MVSAQDSHSHSNPNIVSVQEKPSHHHRRHYTTPPSSVEISRATTGPSMRTVRSNIFQETDQSNSLIAANKSSVDIDEFSNISLALSDFSACSSDISGELQRLAYVTDPELNEDHNSEPEKELLIENISPENLQPMVKLCIDRLQSPSVAARRSAAAKLRLLAKNLSENRALIGESGAIPALIPLLLFPDPTTQEHAVTALLNLSLHETNKALITRASGAIKSFICVLKSGSETSKQNAACALTSLSSTEEIKLSIGACGAIPPLVALLISGGSNRGIKDALTALYKLCSVGVNKERAVSAGAVGPLVGLVSENCADLSEKAMVVLSGLAAVEVGREAIVVEGGIQAFVEAIEEGSQKGKEFAVSNLTMLCGRSCRENSRNRWMLVREGAIPPLVGLSQTGTAKARHMAETLLGYLRESRQEASSSTP